MRFLIFLFFLCSFESYSQKLIIYKDSTGQIVYSDGQKEAASLTGEADIAAFKNLVEITDATTWMDYNEQEY